MPVYSRKVLRQTLGKSYLRDTIATITDLSLGTNPFNQRVYADDGLLGQGLYQNANIYVTGPDNEYRVSSFNTGSGNWVTRQYLATTILSGAEFEIHSRISGTEKNLAIDEALKSIRVRQEVGIATGTAGADFFNIEGAASPHYITDVLDAYWFANPSGSLDRDLRRFSDVRLVMTATGREIRVTPAPGGSAQLVLDAVLQMTLPYVSTATVNLPDDSWLLAGAAARCYNLMIQNTPGQNAGNLIERRNEYAGMFTNLSSRFAPSYTHKVRLEEPEDESSLSGLLTW